MTDYVTIVTSPITHFTGEYSFLSNFYNLDPRSYPWQSVEHAFQAAKTNDPDERKAILSAEGPKLAKQRGRAVTLRPDWELVKVDVMAALLETKFAPGTRLASLLVGTCPRMLAEGNNWCDHTWGVCDRHGNGMNLLGVLLMERRGALRSWRATT